ncbi:glycoside hydrolase family 66 protein [Marinicrinis sediminis]|uniref:Glycoside hydrolase family 66 protein n=1 Tax=Marinicrinis sediminis TaxID=1652465 RepID=A0ABW5REN8_9BACL
MVAGDDEDRHIRIGVAYDPGQLQAVHLRHFNVCDQQIKFNGYGFDVSLYDGTACVQEMSSSFDVVSSWRKSTRYGFLSDFYTSETGRHQDVEKLNKLHLNLIQFYDWMYKHDELVGPESEYTDLMGRKLSLDVVKEKVAACHRYGMKAMAYGAVYAASQSFYESRKDWALYDSNGNVLDFIDIFYMMNVAEESPWHDHIIGEYRKTIEQVDFDGIHMDTYGTPKTAISKWGGEEKVVKLEEHFPALINHTREALEQVKEDIALIFNNVGNWPVDTVAVAEQDAMYIEVWNPYERYHHIQQIIAWARHFSQDKPVILAAYLKPFRLEAMEKAEISALLLTAAITSNGGYHLLLGEDNAVLTQGYYVDYSLVGEPFMRTMRNYYDFIIRYANLFFDASLRDVSMTHAKGDNQEYQLTGAAFSTYGEADKVWTIIREKRGRKVVSLVNLVGNLDDRWNEGKDEPARIELVEMRIQVEEQVKDVYMASPDEEMGRPQPVPYELVESDKGMVVVAQIPNLYIWKLLVIELGAK